MLAASSSRENGAGYKLDFKSTTKINNGIDFETDYLATFMKGSLSFPGERETLS